MTVHEAFLEQDLLDLQNKVEEREKRIAELEKENAELKKWKEDTIKARGNDYMAWSRQNDQLTKAIELLKQWLQTSKASSCDNINIVTDTEQFISEVEK